MTTIKSLQIGLIFSALLGVGCAMGNDPVVGNDVAFLRSTQDAPAGCESVRYSSQEYSFTLLESSLVAVLDESGHVVCVDSSEAVADDLVQQGQLSEANVVMSWGSGRELRRDHLATVDAISRWVRGENGTIYGVNPNPEPMNQGDQAGPQPVNPNPEPMNQGDQVGPQPVNPNPEPMNGNTTNNTTRTTSGGSTPGETRTVNPNPEPMLPR